MPPADDDRCPCGSGASWAGCCGPYLAGEREAPTAEALMRSRFSAFAVGDAGYLLRTWHRGTRPRQIELDPETLWWRLDVLSARGGPDDDTGEVEFIAHQRSPGGRGRLHEKSAFERVRGRWVYRDGISDPRG